VEPDVPGGTTEHGEGHGDRFGAFIGLAHRYGRPDLGIDFAINGTGLFGPAPVETWREIAPWIRHCHGKFFGIDEHGEEPSVPVRELVGLLVDIGYTGAISSEYEGWHWNYGRAPSTSSGASRPSSARPRTMPVRGW
jgi:hypothetical protein